jgi:transcriptional regulator with XRE-family HTH domain
METLDTPAEAADARLASRLRELRRAKRWSLDELAARSGVSRASLSRIENADVSPTAAVLGRLAHAHGATVSSLLAEVDNEAPALVPRAAQREWIDPETGFRRRFVSPPAPGLACELIGCELPAGAEIDYPLPPRPGLEHHLYLEDGELELTVEGETYRLQPGDCLRYRLNGASRFRAPGKSAARYLLVIR